MYTEMITTSIGWYWYSTTSTSDSVIYNFIEEEGYEYSE